MRYEPLKAPRFTTESVDGVDQIRIKSERHVFLSLFMLFWLGCWTVAGLSVLGTLHTHFSVFLVFWLGAWAVGWSFAALQLGWFFTGSEIFRVINGDLEVAYRIFGVTIRKLFRGRDIHGLTVRQRPPASRYRVGLPFASWSRLGCIQFSYGARTIYAGTDLDEVEGRMIVERLLKRLPSAAASAPAGF